MQCRCDIDPTYAVCKYCGQRIIWTVTNATNAKMPVDPEPTPTGNVTLVASNDETDIYSDVMRWPQTDPKLLAMCRHQNHLVTCPVNGKKARRGR